jgi:type II secretory pathway pseudopilin PulG
MLRRTVPARDTLNFRYKGGLKVQRDFLSHTGFESPYHAYRHRQHELYRNAFEAQFSHLRKIYAKQWYEAYIANADEYVTKYNITKAATMARWEEEMEQQEAKRRDVFEMTQARGKLKSKHADLTRELRERRFFHWYERASERLQYMEQTMTFVKREDINAHIEKELSKYQIGSSKSATDVKRYPLNFAGQMPFLENGNLQIVAAARHNLQQYQADNPRKRRRLRIYDPPENPTSAKGASAAAESPRISAAVHGLDAEEFEGTLMASVIDDMADEETLRRTGPVEKMDEEGARSDVQRLAKRREYIDRGKVSLRGVTQRAPSAASAGSPTIAESRSMSARALKREQQTQRNQELQRQAIRNVVDTGLADLTHFNAPRVDVTDPSKPHTPEDDDVRIGEIRAQKKPKVMPISMTTLEAATEVAKDPKRAQEIKSSSLLNRPPAAGGGGQQQPPQKKNKGGDRGKQQKEGQKHKAELLRRRVFQPTGINPKDDDDQSGS